MLIECELIGGPFDGKIIQDDTEKKRFRALVIPFKNRSDNANWENRWLACEYYRKSIDDTKYYYFNAKENKV